MSDEDWNVSHVRAIGLRLAGDAIAEQDDLGGRILDDTFLLLLNAHHEPIPFSLPKAKRHWELLLTTDEAAIGEPFPLPPGPFTVEGRSMALLRTPKDIET
jgi:glycogen operon protein